MSDGKFVIVMLTWAVIAAVLVVLRAVGVLPCSWTTALAPLWIMGAITLASYTFAVVATFVVMTYSR